MSKEKQIEEMKYDICTAADYCYGACEECNLGHLAEHLYNAGYRKQSGWISVEERLPTENGDYLVYVKYGYIEIERYKMWDDDDLDGGFWWELEGHVTHWMPLPEAPKGGVDDE